MTEILDRPAVRAALAAIVSVALTVHAVNLSQGPDTANHDVGWTIYAAGQLLDGAEFGVDLIDNNPPLIYWLSTLVVAAARALHLHVFTLYNLVALALIVGSAWLCWRLLAVVIPVSGARDSIGLALAAAPVVLAGYGFAQRDQLIAALLLPYIVAAARAAVGQAPSRALRLGTGLAAGLALALKPHYVLVWCAVELIVLVRRRRLTSWNRPENWTVAAIGIAYVASVLIAAPEYLETVRDTLAVYHAYDNPVPWLLPKVAIIGFALAALAICRPRSAAGTAAIAAVAAAIVGLCIVVIQKKGFTYHYIPMQVAAFLAIALAIGDWLARAGERGGWLGTAAIRRLPLAVTLASMLALQGAWLSMPRFPDRLEVTAAIEEHADGRPVLYFSSSVDPLFPSLVFTDSSSASPYSCLWLIPGNYSRKQLGERPFPYRSLDEMGDLERRFVTSIVDAMEYQQPGLLLFDRRSVKQAFGLARFEFERYFMADPRFLPLMRSFTRIGSVGSAEGYRRVDEGGASGKASR